MKTKRNFFQTGLLYAAILCSCSADAKNVLLVGSTSTMASFQPYLSASNNTSTVVAAANFGTTSFAGYDAIWLGEGTSFSGLLTRSNDLVSFAQGGGSVLFEMTSILNPLGDYPFGSQLTRSVVDGDPVHITDAGDPANAGLTDAGLSNWGKTWHSLLAAANGFDRLQDNAAGSWITVKTNIGLGRITFTCLHLSHLQPAGIRFFNNVVALGNALPAITTQPANQTVVLTSNATFSVTASGVAPLAYQWLFNGSIISSATNTSLTISNASYASLGNYQVIITNSYGSVTSSVAQLILDPLDLTFNGTGKATTPIGSADDYGHALAIQTDGKIVLAGYAWNGTHNDVAVVRYNTNGTLDTTFNGTGKLTTSIGSASDAQGVALQADGKILVCGDIYTGSSFPFMVARYNTNGTLDTTFNGSGIVTTAIGIHTSTAYGIAVQSDGKIVAAGGSNRDGTDDFAVVRYNADGSLDTTFNGTGIVVTPIGSDSDVAFAVKIQSDGKILLAGRSIIGGNATDALVRYNANGSLDTSFNGTGKVTTSIGGVADGDSSITLQSDGKIVAGGYAKIGGIYNSAVVRYNANGSLDTNFNGTGKVTTGIGGYEDYGNAVTLQSDGKIVVAGQSSNGSHYNFGLARYNPDGSLDTSFGFGGKLLTVIGGTDDTALSMVIQNDGKIVLAGYSYTGANYDFAVVRYDFKLASTIVAQPQGFAAECGGSTNLSVQTLGAAPMTYQWRLSGTNLPGATGSNYVFTASSAAVGNYSVVVSNFYGVVTSSVANVTLKDITAPQFVTFSYTNTTVNGSASCQAAVPDLRPQVLATDCSGSVTIGQTPAPGTLVGVGVTNITVTATDASNNVAYEFVPLTVKDVTPPNILTCATNMTIALGNSATTALPDLRGQIMAMDCSAYGISQSPAPGTPIGAGPTTVTLFVYDVAGNTNTCTATVTGIATPPSIVTSPGTYTVSPGGSATFTVGANGTPPFSYQWQLNGTNIAGANSASYTVPNAAGTNAGSYTVVVCNAANCATSSAGSLAVMGLDIYPGLLIYGPVGAAYRIDYSEDLGSPTNWLELTNLTLLTSPYLFPDPTPARQVKRFYRAVKQ